MKSAGMNAGHILRSQWKSLAYARTYPVNSAALIFAVVGKAQAAASSAPDTFTASLGPPGNRLSLI